MRKIYLVFTIFLLTAALFGKSVSLSDCIKSALENSHEIRIAEKNKQITDLQSTKALLSFVPDANLYYSVNENKDKDRTGTLNLRISQRYNLFDSRIYNYKEQKINQTVEQLNYINTRKKLIIDVVNLYFDISLLKRKKKINNKMRDMYSKEKKYLISMLQSGYKNQLDIFSIEMEIQDIDLALEDINSKIKNKLRELVDKTKQEISSIDSISLDQLDFDNGSMVFSKFNNIDYKIKEQEIEKSENIFSQSFKNILPDMGVVGEYVSEKKKFWKESNALFDQEGNKIRRDRSFSFWNVSLNVSYSLDKLTEHLHSHRISKRRLLVAKYELNKLMDKLNRDAELKNNEIELSINKTRIKKKKLEYAEKKVKLMQQLFKTGQIDFTELRNTNREWLNSTLDLLEEQYKKMRLFADIQRYNGKKIFGKYE